MTREVPSVNGVGARCPDCGGQETERLPGGVVWSCIACARAFTLNDAIERHGNAALPEPRVRSAIPDEIVATEEVE